ncbi:MAG: prephenate dehydrogenase [Gaiellaceae bacterium]
MRLAVVGDGLIGTSVVLAARRAGIEHISTAHDADLVLVAVPVGVLPEVVVNVLAATDESCTVTDVGSTKASVCAAAGNSPRFVGGHPMCGGERPSAELFDGATWFLTKECALVRSFVTALGAVPVIVDAQEHDRLVALTSHLPHALANLLAIQAGPCARAAGPSLRDMTRVAGANPSVWVDIFLDNRDALLAALAAHRQAAEQLEAMLEAGDAEALERWIADAAANRERVYTRPPSSGSPASAHSSLPPE